MDSKEENGFLKKFLKSIIYTIVITIGTFVLDYLTAGNSYLNGVLVDTQNNSRLIIVFAGIVFTVIFCTLTILEEIKKK